MAPSSPPTSLVSSFSSDSCLNSTCGLFSVLDLNHSQTRIMGDMNTDLIVDVPDTPDRLVARQNNKGKCVWKETHSSLSSHLNKSDPLDGNRRNGFRGIGRLVNENDHEGSFVMSRKNHIFNDVQDRGKSINLSSPENSHALPNHHYKRAAIDKPSNLEIEKSTGVQNMDNVRSKIMPSVGKENSIYLDVKKQNHYSYKSEIVSDNSASTAFQLENVAKDSASYGEGSSILHILDSPKQSNHVFHGKEKVDDNNSQDLGLSVPLKKAFKNSTDGRHRFEKQVPELHCNVTSTRTSGRKRLVRNGCISPNNIAMKATQLVKQESSNSKIVFHSLPQNSPPTSSCLFDTSDIVSEGIHTNKDKGKGVIVHPSTFQAYDSRKTAFDLSSKRIHGSTSHTAGDTGKGDAELDAAQQSEELGGWRSTRSRSMRIDHPFSDASGVSSQIKSNNITRCDSEYGLEGRDIAGSESQIIQNHYGGNTDANHRDLRFMSNVGRIAEPNRTENELSKRQRKQGYALINNRKCNVSDIICLDSPGESSNSRSSRIQSRQSRSHSMLRDPIVGFGKLSPGMAQPVPRESRFPNNDESHDARMRQLEADEKLARELQEQLYHDLPFIEFSEFDENIALALQQEEETFLASSGGIRSASHTRRQPMGHSRRQPRSRAFQIASDRTGIRRMASNYNRVDLRSRFSSSSSRVSSRDRGLRFPLDMDLDMRIDILEALEAAVGDDMNDTRVSNHTFQLHHDFNDADYEMLLTLDDNNHCHAGATVNQINTLPQSTVQIENVEEACAICLEAPTAGDIIRHLPCFHKFHKDCIDPWLRRKTSCPVCKFSIT